MSIAQMVFERSECFVYTTRLFSVIRDAKTTNKTATRKQKEQQEIINPKHLRTPGRLKQEAFRTCRAYATKLPMFDLWIAPNEDTEMLSKLLSGINAEWDTWMNDELFPNYERWVEEYVKGNPKEAAEILRLAPPLAVVRSSTRFACAHFSLKDANIQSINLEEEVDGLWGQVLHEVASDIKDAKMHESQSFTQASRQVLDRIARKCKGLGFLHPRLAEVTSTVGELLSQMPPTGSIKGAEALAVRHVLDRLLNPAEFMRRGFGVGGQVSLDFDKPDAATQASPQDDDVISITGNSQPPSASDPSVVAEEPVREEPEEAATTDGTPSGVPSLDDILGSTPVAPSNDDDLDADPEEDAPSLPQSQPEHQPVREPALTGTDFEGW